MHSCSRWLSRRSSRPPDARALSLTTTRPTPSPRHVAIPLAALIVAGLALACGGETRAPAVATDASLLGVTTRELGSVTQLARDTLSDSVVVTGLHPAPDGSDVAYRFHDPARAMGEGLALMPAGGGGARLVWPDSVTDAWWSGPRELAFTTATGTPPMTRVVLDVRADSLALAPVTDTTHRPPAPTPPVAIADEAGLRSRLTRYVDSVRVQPQGTPRDGTLRYEVLALLPSPDGSLAAAYVAANDAAGRTNPTWYVATTRPGKIVPLDSIIGPGRALPADAATWATNDRFVYAKGNALWLAEVQRRERR